MADERVIRGTIATTHLYKHPCIVLVKKHLFLGKTWVYFLPIDLESVQKDGIIFANDCSFPLKSHVSQRTVAMTLSVYRLTLTFWLTLISFDANSRRYPLFWLLLGPRFVAVLWNGAKIRIDCRWRQTLLQNCYTIGFENNCEQIRHPSSEKLSHTRVILEKTMS